MIRRRFLRDEDRKGNAKEDDYRRAVYKAVWQDKLNIADAEVFTQILTAIDLNPEEVLAATKDEAVKNALKSNTEEAAKRGLSNNQNTPDALQVNVSPASIELFTGLEILSKKEIEARYEIQMDEYTLRIQIESRVLGDIARNHVIPTAIKYQNVLIENVKGLKEIYGNLYKELGLEQLHLIESISEHIGAINQGIDTMTKARKEANKLTSSPTKAKAYCEEVKPFLTSIRYHCDKLELLVEDRLWPLTKYRELLFSR